MKLKDFKKLNENWEKWSQPESVAEEKKNCGCGQDPCVTYGAQNESVEQVSEGRYHFANSFDELDISEDPRAQAFEQCIKILNELTYDSLEDEIASMADAAARSLWKAAEELDYKRNQVGNVDEAVSPEQQEANEKAYSLCYEMGRKGVDVHTARRKVAAADFQACRAGHQDGSNEFMQSLAERVRKTVVNKLQEKAKSKNQQQFMGMVKKCQDTGDCASDEVKKAADSMKKSDVKDFASTKHKGLPNKVEDKK